MMNLKIISPSKLIFDGKATKINVPGQEGSFQIFKDHAPIISYLRKGTIDAFNEDIQILNINIENGLLKLTDNNVLILI